LNINLNINNENQDCKTGTECGEGVQIGVGRVKEGRRKRKIPPT
jgi:hypothetical protein